MRRRRSDFLTRALVWVVLFSAAYKFGQAFSPQYLDYAALEYPLWAIVFLFAFILGSNDIDQLNACRHSKRSLYERLYNTFRLRRFILTVEELLALPAVGVIFGVLSQRPVMSVGAGNISLDSLFPTALAFFLGLILGLRTMPLTCISCNQHISSEINFNFRPITSPANTSIPERCLLHARESALWMTRWMADLANEGGVVVLDGEIGSGKSTFKNLVLHYLSDIRRDLIIVEISAWETVGEKEIQKRVLSEVISGLENSYSLGSYRLGRFGLLDSLARGEPRLSPLMWAASHLSTEDFLADWRDLFLSLNHQVLVVVEDLERFSARELFALLRLIDELREFPHLTFFLPIDRSECLRILNETQEWELPLDWASVLDRTLAGSILHSFTPSAAERFDLLLARFSDVGNRWAADQ